MDGVYRVLTDNICLLYFLNGLAFFAFGFAVALEVRWESLSPVNRGLPLLAAYGFVASVGNWLQMILISRARITGIERFAPWQDALILSLFILGAVLLLRFGVSNIIAYDSRLRWLGIGSWLLVVGYAGVLVAVVAGAHSAGGRSWLPAAEVWARYLLNAPALGVASLALLLRRRQWSRLGLDHIASDCLAAGSAFGLKLVVSGLIAVPTLGLPAATLSMWILPLQVLRTLTIVGIAFFITRMLRSTEIQRQRQLDEAVTERLEVQESALSAQKQACDEIEQWSASMADMVHTISRAISQPVALAEIMQTVLQETIKLSGLESGAIWLLDKAHSTLELASMQGLPEFMLPHLSRVKVGDGVAGWVAEKGELLVIDDMANDPRPFVPRTSEFVRFAVGIPLKAGSRTLGVLNLSSMEWHELTPQQIVLLTSAGHQLGVAIENSRLYQRVRYLATAEERSRLAREIHDNLSQLLGYLSLRTTSTEQLLAQGDVEKARRSLREVKQIAQDAYADARETIFSLRATTRGAGLLEALREYLDDYGTYYGLNADLSIDDPALADFPADVGIQVSCIIQEALTNVRKHAGATKVWLRFEARGSEVQISVQDNGRGFDPEKTTTIGGMHFGLSIMRERAESVGGRLEVVSESGEGTRVVVFLPRPEGS